MTSFVLLFQNLYIRNDLNTTRFDKGMKTLLIKGIRRLEQNFQAPKMCYTQEGYVQTSGSDILGLEQLKTLFYSLFAMELIGFAVRIGENVAERVLKSRSTEAGENTSSTLKGKYPILCQRCSSNLMLIPNQTDWESDGILELKNQIFSENIDMREEIK